MKKNIVALAFFVLCIPFISFAHPGHGETGGYTITHYFAEPVHVIISLIALSAVVVFIRSLNRNKQQQENN